MHHAMRPNSNSSMPCSPFHAYSPNAVVGIPSEHRPNPSSSSQHQTMPKEKKPPTPVVNRHHFCCSPRASVSITTAFVSGANFRLEMGRMGGGWRASANYRRQGEKERERRRGAVGRRKVDDRQGCFAFPMPGTRRAGRARSRAEPREVQKPSPQRIVSTTLCCC